jgi:hypothetical protein
LSRTMRSSEQPPVRPVGARESDRAHAWHGLVPNVPRRLASSGQGSVTATRIRPERSPEPPADQSLGHRDRKVTNGWSDGERRAWAATAQAAGCPRLKTGRASAPEVWRTPTVSYGRWVSAHHPTSPCGSEIGRTGRGSGHFGVRPRHLAATSVAGGLEGSVAFRTDSLRRAGGGGRAAPSSPSSLLRPPSGGWRHGWRRNRSRDPHAAVR